MTITLKATANLRQRGGRVELAGCVMLAAGFFMANLKASRLPLAVGKVERCRKHGMMANIEIKPAPVERKANVTCRGVGRPRTVWAGMSAAAFFL